MKFSSHGTGWGQDESPKDSVMFQLIRPHSAGPRQAKYGIVKSKLVQRKFVTLEESLSPVSLPTARSEVSKIHSLMCEIKGTCQTASSMTTMWSTA